MKVTAIIEDQLIQEAIKYSKATTITEALKVALKVYVAQEKLKSLGEIVKNSPLKFSKTAEQLRKLNREI